MQNVVPAPLIGSIDDPVDELAVAQNAIRAANWWTRAGLSERWPLSTEEATALLSRAGEFLVAETTLCDLLCRGLLPRPIIDDEANVEWSAVDILNTGALLEMRDQWRASPGGHDPKKHPCQVILERARAAGEVESVAKSAGAPHFDVTHLLALLSQCDNREGRQKLIPMLKAVLEVDHGIFVP